MMGRRRPNKAYFTVKCRGAFTLLEMVLGGLVAALAGLVLFQVLYNGIVSYQRTQTAAKVYLQMFKVMDAFGSSLSSTVHIDLTAIDAQWSSFSGNHTSLRMVVKAPDGLRQLMLGWKEGSGGGAILGQESCPLASVIKHMKDGCSSEILARGLTDKDGIELEYAQESPQAESGHPSLTWKEEWADTMLPAAVKLNIRFSVHHQNDPVEFTRTFYLPNR